MFTSSAYPSVLIGPSSSPSQASPRDVNGIDNDDHEDDGGIEDGCDHRAPSAASKGAHISVVDVDPSSLLSAARHAGCRRVSTGETEKDKNRLTHNTRAYFSGRSLIICLQTPLRLTFADL